MTPLMMLAAALQPAPGPSLAEVIPGANRYFHRGEEMRGCPSLTAKCRRAGYVIPGDRLVVWERRGTLSHVEFINARGVHTEGWIETAGLTTVVQTPAPLSAWQGEWHRTEASITISRSPRPNRLLISGLATWGGSDPSRGAIGAVNDGQIWGEIVPVKNYGAFATADLDERGGVVVPDGLGGSARSLSFTAPGKDRCRAEMWLRLPYLVVVDQGRYGGLNVTFSGVYRK